MQTQFNPSDVSAIVCTWNSIASIQECLESILDSKIGQLIVVDAHSTDGTRQVAEKYADIIIDDPGLGLGLARNMGIQVSNGALVLNMGSDNVMPKGALVQMIHDLVSHNADGVSAQTHIQGKGFIANGLNAWRQGRFRPGPSQVIGTPTLFKGNLLRADPFDPTAVYSDDSELCERWIRKYGSKFAISSAKVSEVGKTSWVEVKIRCRMYGISDQEVYTRGTKSGWSLRRRMKSVTHPARSDLITPIAHLKPTTSLINLPFLATFTTMRYFYWGQASRNSSGSVES
jgi:glycosyltransferase involved in cell wall biosynthesis